ncbi:TonB-dependent receptor [Pseudoruegeria sp. HB172150]|uniref:TonB-dependent receptor n=1 Tax=Pseudoruegeria sp. HB172150 TaxID=2721164 RepID=UPI001C1326BE|nr:TonB-dependent receptor [Pseudoruegeria sp. HB172150]
MLSYGISALTTGAALAQSGDAEFLGVVYLYGDRSASVIEDSTASVAVLDEEALDTPALFTFQDVFGKVANVMPGPTVESGFVIRGINSEGQTPGGIGAPLATLYVDGAPQTVESARRGFRGLFDVEQVEIYRGPTSTLTGRAGLAGAVYLRTVEPDFEKSGHIQLTYGENNHRQVGIAFGDGLSETLAYRISGEWSAKDTDINYPSYEKYALYDDFSTDEYYNIRGRLLWLPTGSEATKVLLSYGHSFDSPYKNSVVGPAWTGPLSVSYDDMRGDSYGELLPTFYNSLGVYLLPLFAEVRETTTDSASIEVTHEVSDFLKFTAQTGWTSSLTDRRSINVGTDPSLYIDFGEFLEGQGEFKQEIFSQEFRLNYDDGAGMRWVAGVYGALENNSSWRDYQQLTFDQSRNTSDVTNLAAFGEITYEFAPGWSVIAGGRVDYYKQEQTALFSSDFVTITDTETTFEDTVFIPKIGLAYEFANDQTVSLVYQEGYRPGGAGVRASDGAYFSYDAETARNLELTHRGTLMDGALTVSTSVFYQDWDNQQVEIYAESGNPVSGYIANAGKSESFGAELELDYAYNDRLNLFASAGLLHTEFTDFVLPSIDYTGESFPGAPEQSLTLGYRWGADTGWFHGATVTHVGQFLSTLSQDSLPIMNDSYTLVDLQAGYAWDQASLTVYANNVLDEGYFVNESGPGSQAVLGDRREIGVRLDYRF